MWAEASHYLCLACGSLIETTLQAKSAAPYARFGATYWDL